jgi:hypothetical protein
MSHPALRLLVCALFLGAEGFAADSKPVRGAPATPPPKKKRGELEAEEQPAPIPPSRDSAPKEESYNIPMPLIGQWEAAGRRLVILASGAYALTGAETDAGFVRAGLGLVWRKSNRTQKWVEGRYLFRDISVLEIEGIFGTGEWRRVK